MPIYPDFSRKEYNEEDGSGLPIVFDVAMRVLPSLAACPKPEQAAYMAFEFAEALIAEFNRREAAGKYEP